MRVESYGTAGISITQGVPRGGCTVGFTPLVCVCVCLCVCVCECVCVNRDKDPTVRHSRSIYRLQTLSAVRARARARVCVYVWLMLLGLVFEMSTVCFNASKYSFLEIICCMKNFINM